MLDFLWHSTIAWFGLAGVIVIASLAVAWFIPPFRRLALAVAGFALAIATVYNKGLHDEERKWNEAEDRAVKKGAGARNDAERDLAAGRLRDDEFDRDKS